MTCYSDHNEDIRTKGSCDYCGDTRPDVDCAALAKREREGNLGGLAQVAAHQACGLDLDPIDTTSPTHAG